MKLLKSSDLPPAFGGMDTKQLLKSSRAARWGLRFIQAGALLRASSTIIVVAAACMLAALPALAQQGGSILGNDASRPVSLAKRGIDIFSYAMMLLGIIGLGQAIQLGRRKDPNWSTVGGWGVAGIGFGFIVSWINSEVNGNQVALPEP